MRQSKNNFNSNLKTNTRRLNQTFAVSFGKDNNNNNSHCWPDAFSFENNQNKNIKNKKQQKIKSFSNNFPFTTKLLNSENNRNNNGKIHIHTIYLILIITLLNLIVLLCLVHFRIVLIYPANNNYNNSIINETFSALNGNKSLINSTIIQDAQISHLRSQKSEKYFLEEKNNEKENNTNNINNYNNLTNAQLEKVKYNILKEPHENKLINISTKQLINNCITSTLSSIESDFDLLIKTSKPIQSSTPIKHYLVDCTTEEDNQGMDKCIEWQRAGFCKIHPATKWLFCRRQCLCF